jgi:hypothetical protein
MTTRKIIAHMPGAAGNFMTRLLEQSHTPQHPITEAAYGDDHPWRGPLHGDWTRFEDQWQSERYRNHHARDHAWLRITVASAEEWQWAQANALWKNSDLEGYHTASDPDLPAEHHLPLRHLWSWPELEQALHGLQQAPVNTHQHRLWRQWRDTWCPHTHTARWQRLCDRRWRHLRPDRCGP